MEIQAELTGLVVVVLAALLCGMAMARLRQPAVVGYIVAGIALGPSGFGLVENRVQIGFFAELGVLLLLFLVGMELSLRAFRAIWLVAVGAALLQIAGGIGVALLLSYAFGWSLGMAVLLGFVVALSSTAVVIKMLEGMNLLRTQVGQVTVSILIAQDLAVVPMLLILQGLAGEAGLVPVWVPIVLSVAFLGLLIWFLSRRRRVRLPLVASLAGQVDLRPLYGLTFCFGAATLSGLLELTPAYGAFLAGLVVGNSTARRVMLRSIQPIQSILMMVFFLSIGLLIDLGYIWQNIGTVLLILFVVTVVKTAFNIGIIYLLREPWPHAFIAGLMLAQVGEFSFLIGETGVDLGLIGRGEQNLIIAVTALTLVISPLWLVTARRILRIALLHVSSLQATVQSLYRGGFAGVWKAAMANPPSDLLSHTFFGRPRRRLGAPPDAAGEAPPQEEEAGGPGRTEERAP